jgi:predicted alpha/beta-fold hydrolase
MPTEFEPLPFLGNPHVQTVLANLFRGRALRFPVQERFVLLPDGDRLVLHDSIPESWRPGDRIALLIHGLGGSHRSGYMNRMARLLLPYGLRVVRMDLRGCGRGMALARLPYHGGLSEDLRAAATALDEWSPGSPVVMIGFSLGGNIALKLAGEAVQRAVPNLQCVAALSPPIDLVKCAEILAQPRNRFYELHYVRGLVKQVRQRQRINPDEPATLFPRRMTMRLFDDLYTAPRWGFDDAMHYYRSASSVALVPHIAAPCFVLTARDDPFVAVESFDNLAVPPHVDVNVVERGGHLGFLGWHENGVRWAEHRVAQWVVGR